MTAQEIYDYVRKNVPLTRTNGVRVWSEWHTYKPENYAAMFDASLLARRTGAFELQIKQSENLFRIRCILLQK